MTRQVSFCFDDGFRDSAQKVCRIFEQRDLAACFCVLAAPQLAEDPFIRAAPIADWAYWREVLAAGHEVGPHGYAHEHLGRLTFDKACDSVQRTLDVFRSKLPGFDARQSIFHAAYLAAPAQVVEWIGERTLGVRMALGGAGRNDLAAWTVGRPIDCMTFGPPDSAALAQQRIERFLTQEEGWLVLVFHGLDGEGWGTLSSNALERLLDALLDRGVDIVPPNARLRREAGAR